MQSYHIITVSALLVLTSCTDKTSGWKVKTEYHVNKFKEQDSVYINDGVTRTLIYGEDGKLKGNNISNGNTIEFISTKATDTTKTFDSSGKLLNTDVWIKNEQGLADSVIHYDVWGTSQKFIYDSEGNKTEVRSYKLGHVLQFLEKKKYVTGLNVSSNLIIIGSVDTIVVLNPVTMKPDTVVQKTEGDTSTFYYDFYPNKETSQAYVKYLKEHWGDGSVQLKKRGMEVSNKGDTTNTYNYRYTFDEQNRVTSIVSESKSHAEYDSTGYTYY